MTKYNARASWNTNIKLSPNVSKEKLETLEEIDFKIEECLKQNIKLYVCDPFIGGSLFEVKRFNREKQLFYLFQPQIVASTFGRKALEIVMTRDFYLAEISKGNNMMLFFTDFGDFLNAKSVKEVEIKEVVKIQKEFVEKQTGVSQNKIDKAIKKVLHDSKGKPAFFVEGVEWGIEQLKKLLEK
jgi:hypothetical protein